MKSMIWITFKMPGIHCWPTAPEHRDYLRQPHRHLFGVKVATAVDHDDREIEFHDLLDQAKAIFADGLEGPDALPIGRSCETMARRLGVYLSHAHKRLFTVTVDEDGECGATVECQ